MVNEKRLHDLEMLIDERKPTPPELSEDQVFRYELLQVLERIAKALEKPIQVRSSY